MKFLPLVFLVFFGCNMEQKTEVSTVKEDIVDENFELYASNEGQINVDQFYKKELDLPYTQPIDNKLTLDIIYPCNENLAKPYKLIVVFHGGGWMFGDKRYESLKGIFQVLSQGYAIATVNTSLSGRKQWPNQLFEAKTAIRFLRANAKKYQLDTENIVVWGGSSGAHLALMLATTNGYDEFEDKKLGYAKLSSAVQGAVSWYGISNVSQVTGEGIEAANSLMGFNILQFPERTFRANPINYVTTSVPKILLVHGTKDKIVPYIQSVQMYDKIINLSKDASRAKLITIEGARHSDPQIKNEEMVLQNLDFVDDIIWKGNNPYRTDRTIKIEIDSQK